MIITVAKVSPQAQHGLRTLVREEHHQIAVDAELAAPEQPKSIISPGLSLVTTPAEPVNKVDLQKVHKVVESAIWPLAKEKIPFSNPTIDGVEVVFAGKQLWDRIATEDKSDRSHLPQRTSASSYTTWCRSSSRRSRRSNPTARPRACSSTGLIRSTPSTSRRTTADRRAESVRVSWLRPLLEEGVPLLPLLPVAGWNQKHG